MLIVTPIVGFCNCCMFCCALLCVHFSFAIILIGKRERERERESWLLCFVFLVSHDCCMTLPYDAMGLSAVCDFGVS